MAQNDDTSSLLNSSQRQDHLSASLGAMRLDHVEELRKQIQSSALNHREAALMNKIELAEFRKDQEAALMNKIELAEFRKDQEAALQYTIKLAEFRKDREAALQYKIELAEFRKDREAALMNKIELAEFRKDQEAALQYTIKLAEFRKDRVTESKAKLDLATFQQADSGTISWLKNRHVDHLRAQMNKADHEALHILHVKLVGVQESERQEILREIEALVSAKQPSTTVDLDRQRLISWVETLESPSEIAKSPAKIYRSKFVCNPRHFIAAAIPAIAMFDSFYRLLNDLSKLEDVDLTSVLLKIGDIDNLIHHLCEAHNTELEKKSAIQSHLNALFSHFDQSSSINTSRSEVFADFAYKLDDRLLIVVELKNEAGKSGDPLAQAIAYYAKFWFNKNNKSQYNNVSMCPSLLMTIVGAKIEFYCACTDKFRIIVEPLVTLDLRAHNEMTLRRTAAVFALILRTAGDIAEHFKKQTQLPFCDRPDVRQLPRWPTSTNQPKMSTLSMIAVHYNDRIHAEKLLFGCTTSDNQNALLKITRQYNPSVHSFLADKNFAPKLFGYADLGDHQLVLMERLDTTQYVTLHEFISKKQQYTSEIKKRVATALREAMEEMHTQLYVHGDFRDHNIMVKKSPETNHVSTDLIKIIDFDFAGIAGKSAYWFSMNVHINWHRDVKKGAIMVQDHDKHFFSYYVELLSS